MIPGISDVRRLPRLGKIRLGEKKGEPGHQYPSALDHFSFKDVPWVQDVYGDACKELDIIFPIENQEVFFNQALRAYRKSGLFCKCEDGVTATRIRVGPSDGTNPKGPAKGQPLDPDGEEFLKEMELLEDINVGDMFEMPCPHTECFFFQKKLCKGVGKLFFMLPKVPKFGCYEIDTTSMNGMVAINSYLDAIRGVAGRVSRIPLKLRLVPKKVQPEGKAKTIFFLEIVYEGTVQQLQKVALALPAPAPAAVLPTKKEAEEPVPEDLYAQGGQVLEDVVGADKSAPPPPPAASAADAKDLLGGKKEVAQAPKPAAAAPPVPPAAAAPKVAAPAPQKTPPPPPSTPAPAPAPAAPKPAAPPPAKPKAPGILF